MSFWHAQSGYRPGVIARAREVLAAYRKDREVSAREQLFEFLMGIAALVVLAADVAAIAAIARGGL